MVTHDSFAFLAQTVFMQRQRLKNLLLSPMQSSFLKLLTRELLATTNTMRAFSFTIVTIFQFIVLFKFYDVGEIRCNFTARSTVEVQKIDDLFVSSGRQNCKCDNFTLLFCREQHRKSSTSISPCFSRDPFLESPETFREHFG